MWRTSDPFSFSRMKMSKNKKIRTCSKSLRNSIMSISGGGEYFEIFGEKNAKRQQKSGRGDILLSCLGRQDILWKIKMTISFWEWNFCLRMIGNETSIFTNAGIYSHFSNLDLKSSVITFKSSRNSTKQEWARLSSRMSLSWNRTVLNFARDHEYI